MYRLICVKTGEPITDAVYASPEEAILAKAGVNQPCRIARVITNEWQGREYTRLTDGTYRPLPSFLTGFSPAIHYAHISSTDPTNIAYTQSPEKGMDDIQTTSPVSTYLARFNPSLPSHAVRDLADRYLAHVRGDISVIVSHTREAFRFAYSGQPVYSTSSSHVSCMAKPAKYYTNNPNLHPAEAYSTDENGLHIAYTTLPTNPNTVTARALIWPAHKQYNRIYALDDSYRTALEDYLHTNGYKRAYDFDGAPLSRIDADTGDLSDEDDGEFLMPYIDGDAQEIDDRPHRKRFYVTTSGDYYANETSGILTVGNASSRHRCAHCGERAHESDMQSVGGFLWCVDCTDSDATLCEHYGEYYDNNVVSFHIVYSMYSGRLSESLWCDEATRYNAFHCERTDNYYASDYFTEVEVIVDTHGTVQTWCLEIAELDATDGEEPIMFQCSECEKYYANNPELRHHGDICMECFYNPDAVAQREANGDYVPDHIRDIRQLAMEV